MRRLVLLSTILAQACAAVTAPPPRVGAPAPRVERSASALPAGLAGLHVRCRDFDDDCTGGVGMLARLEGGEVQRCTVVLVAPDRVLTASHCLPPSQRHARARCDDSWLSFPRVGDAPRGWIGCAEVLSADAVDDASVMRGDVAVLRLTERLDDRPVVELDAMAPAEGSIVTVVGVAPHPIYASQHEIASRRCRVASAESARAVFGPSAGAVGWLMECPSRGGTSGAPVLDGAGRLRALVHAGSAPGHGIAVTSGLRD